MQQNGYRVPLSRLHGADHLVRTRKGGGLRIPH
jgi:hypothetical protein